MNTPNIDKIGSFIKECVYKHYAVKIDCIKWYPLLLEWKKISTNSYEEVGNMERALDSDNFIRWKEILKKQLHSYIQLIRDREIFYNYNKYKSFLKNGATFYKMFEKKVEHELDHLKTIDGQELLICLAAIMERFINDLDTDNCQEFNDFGVIDDDEFNIISTDPLYKTKTFKERNDIRFNKKTPFTKSISSQLNNKNILATIKDESTAEIDYNLSEVISKTQSKKPNAQVLGWISIFQLGFLSNDNMKEVVDDWNKKNMEIKYDSFRNKCQRTVILIYENVNLGIKSHFKQKPTTTSRNIVQAILYLEKTKTKLGLKEAQDFLKGFKEKYCGVKKKNKVSQSDTKVSQLDT